MRPWSMALSGMLNAVTVVHELQRHGSYEVNVGPFTNVWTPEPPRQGSLAMGFYQMPGRGRIAYSIDPDGESVRMRWQPKDGAGREWVGPVPVVATPNFEARSHHGARVAWSAFFAILVGGAVLGAVTGSLIGGLGAGALGGYFIAFTVWGGSKQKAFIAAHYEQRTHGASEVEGLGDDPGAKKSIRPTFEEGQEVSSGQRQHGRVLLVTYVICLP